MFRDILGGIKKEAEKRIAEQEQKNRNQQQQKPPEQRKQQEPQRKRKYRYGKLAAWIKSNYGANFKDHQTNDEVKSQLDQLYAKREGSGKLSGDAKRGFRKYIDNRSYGDLVKVRE